MKMKRSTKSQILSYLEGQDWCSGSQLELMSMEWLTKPSTVSRRLRELYEDGQLDRKLVKGCVWYRKRPKTEKIGYCMQCGGNVQVVTTKNGNLCQKNHLTQFFKDEPNQLFETAPPRFTMDPLAKKAK